MKEPSPIAQSTPRVTTAERDRGSRLHLNPKEWIRSHPIAAFFVLAYIGSWVLWIPVVISKEGLGLAPFHLPAPAPLFLLVSTITGPTLAAFLVQGVAGGRSGVTELRRRLLRIRVNPLWYLLVVLGPPALILLGGTTWLGGAPLAGLIQHWQLVLTAFLPATALGLVVTVFEETGWMGVATPRLQAAYSPLIAAAVVGPLWATWHLPSFFVASSGGAGATGLDLPLIGLKLVVLSLVAIAIRVVATWIFNSAGAAVPLIMLGHSAWDQTPDLMSALRVTHFTGDGLQFTMYASIAVCAIVAAALTRGRLGYRQRPPGEPRTP